MIRLKNWLPALLVMAAIFFFSSMPGNELPNFDRFDFSVKKLGHAFGYALLAASYFRGLGKRPWLAWLLALLYAATDEFHQSFTPGRHPSIWDIAIYDNLGAILGLWISTFLIKPKQKDDARAPSSTTTNR
jgi:VanZ family protein